MMNEGRRSSTNLGTLTSPSLSQLSIPDSAYATSPAMKWAALDIPQLTFNDSWRLQIAPQDLVELEGAQQHAFKDHILSAYLSPQETTQPFSPALTDSGLVSPWFVYQQQQDLFSPQSIPDLDFDGSNGSYASRGSHAAETEKKSPQESSIVGSPEQDVSLSPLTIATTFSHLQQEEDPSPHSATTSSSFPFSFPVDLVSPSGDIKIKPVKPRNVSKRTKTKDGKSFPCSMCSSSFSRNHDLKRHIRIHLGIRPYKCDTCPKSFTRQDALNRHKNIRGCRRALEGADDDDEE